MAVLAALACCCGLLVAPSGCRGLLWATPGGFWPSWRLPVAPGGSWWLPVPLGGFWRLLAVDWGPFLDARSSALHECEVSSRDRAGSRDRGTQSRELKLTPPLRGEEALAEWSARRIETDRPHSVVIVVVVVVVVVESYILLKEYYCWRGSTSSPPNGCGVVSILHKSDALVQARGCTARLRSFVVVIFLDISGSQHCVSPVVPRLLVSRAGKTPTFRHLHIHAQGRGLRGVRFISLRPVVENPSKLHVHV